jgi:hypothetical protein
MIDPTPYLPGAKHSHHWLAAAIFSGIISVWGIEVAVFVNATSVTDAKAVTMMSVFSPADERVAMAAIHAEGAKRYQSRGRDLGGPRQGSRLC